jgi:hypothetical protein
MMNSNGSASNRLPLHNQAKKSGLSFQHGLLCMTFMLASFYVGLILGQQSIDKKCQECLQDHSAVQREYHVSVSALCLLSAPRLVILMH